MSKKVILTLELSDDEVNNVVDKINDVIGENLKYIPRWEWIYE